MQKRDAVLDVLAAAILRRYLAMPALENHSLDDLIGMARGEARGLLDDGVSAATPALRWTSPPQTDSRTH